VEYKFAYYYYYYYYYYLTLDTHNPEEFKKLRRKLVTIIGLCCLGWQTVTQKVSIEAFHQN